MLVKQERVGFRELKKERMEGGEDGGEVEG